VQQVSGVMKDVKEVAVELRDVPATALSRLPLAVILTNPRLEDNPIVYANQAFEDLVGHRRVDVIGRNPRFMQGEGTEPAAAAELRRAVAEARETTVEITNYRADGSAFLNRASISPVIDENGELVLFLGISRDAGQDERSGLMEQLAEIQHRVKNHLAMIVGMIRLQAGAEGAATDYEALARRVEALHLLYEELSAGGVATASCTEVPLGAYVSRIAVAIGHLDGRHGVRNNIVVEEVAVPAETASRIGLLLSEVLTNAFRHAFEGRDAGLVETRLQMLSNGVVRLHVADDGVGMPDGRGWPDRGSLGGRIALSLLRGLKARHSVDSSATGTTVTIDVPLGEEGE
jgi:PAS domain S-box-containing protein